MSFLLQGRWSLPPLLPSCPVTLSPGAPVCPKSTGDGGSGWGPGIDTLLSFSLGPCPQVHLSLAGEVFSRGGVGLTYGMADEWSGRLRTQMTYTGGPFSGRTDVNGDGVPGDHPVHVSGSTGRQVGRTKVGWTTGELLEGMVGPGCRIRVSRRRVHHPLSSLYNAPLTITFRRIPRVFPVYCSGDATPSNHICPQAPLRPSSSGPRSHPVFSSPSLLFWSFHRGPARKCVEGRVDTTLFSSWPLTSPSSRSHVPWGLFELSDSVLSSVQH